MASLPGDANESCILTLRDSTNETPSHGTEAFCNGNPQPTLTQKVGERPESSVANYVRWKLHTRVTLEGDAHTISHLQQSTPTLTQSPGPSSHPRRPIHPPTMTSITPGKVQITMYVERLLSCNVAVLADCHNATTPARWAVKFYRSDWGSSWHLDRELNAYKHCQVLQGAEIPVFYGEWKIYGTPADACSALLMEFVSPGTTVGSLRDGLRILSEGEEKRKARFRLAELHSSGTRAVDRINECEVVHLDLFGDNMVLAGMERGAGESVVIVDFEQAMVFGVAGGWKTIEHWTLFHLAFMPEHGPGRN